MTIDFLGVGAQKAGTSWVYACLYEHQEICAPIKELHFFSRPRYEKGTTWYESHFKNCKGGLKKGEFSTSYLYSDVAAKRIHEHYPETKIIVILRDPIERAYSQYGNAVQAGEIRKDVTSEQYFEEENSALKQGLYAGQLERYYKYFPKEQVLVLIYEDSKKDPATFIRRIYEFLGVDPNFIPSMLHRKVNIARTPRFVAVDSAIHFIAETLRKVGLDRLVFVVKKSGVTDMIRKINTDDAGDSTQGADTRFSDYFKEDVTKLSEMLGRDLITEWNIQ